MGNFEQSIPEQLVKLEKDLRAKSLEKLDINWGHECDCEFCDRDGDDADPEADEKSAKIDQECKDIQAVINRLKTHAKLHGVEINEDKK